MHNVGGDNYKDYLSPKYFDAQLTQLGWHQVDNLRKHVRTCGLSKRIELVITSPLLRTLQTAVGVFGGEGYTDRTDVLPLMVANAGNSGRVAISSLNSPPFIAVELCREHCGVLPCDKRRTVTDYQYLFPAIDFSLIETDEDALWKSNVRETDEELTARGLKFMNWLWTRKEKEIAIVTHSGFLFHTLSAFGNDCHPLVKKEICNRLNSHIALRLHICLSLHFLATYHLVEIPVAFRGRLYCALKSFYCKCLIGYACSFANCELRSMVIVDKSMTGSDLSTTNYPGKIPYGLDSPSDAPE